MVDAILFGVLGKVLHKMTWKQNYYIALNEVQLYFTSSTQTLDNVSVPHPKKLTKLNLKLTKLTEASFLSAFGTDSGSELSLE